MAIRSTRMQEETLRRASTRPTPVWPNLPTAEAFRPIVLIVVLAFPGLLALNYGHLMPASAFWGVCGQRVLAGDVWLFHGVARQGPASTEAHDESIGAEEAAWIPPFFPWCTAIFLATEWANPIILLCLPSYIFWLLSAAVLYRLGRVWFDENTALLTCLLLAVNPVLIAQIQQGEPGTCALFWSLLCLWMYSEHFQRPQNHPWLVISVGGVALGALALTVGFSAAWLPLLAWSHLLYEQFRARTPEGPLAGKILTHPSLFGGIIVVGIAAMIVAPWIWMVGLNRFLTGPETFPTRTNASGLVRAMPATLVLAAFGLWLSARQRIRRAGPVRRSSIPVFWTFIAMAAFLTVEPTAAGLLLAVTPLTLMAVRTLELVVERRLSDRLSLGLILVTFWTFVLSLSPAIVTSSATVVSSWLADPIVPENIDAQPQLGWRLLEIHLAVDVMIVGTVLLVWLYRVSGRRDRFRRALFGGFAAAVVLLTAVVGAARLATPLRSSDPWANLYEALNERRKQEPFDWYVLLGKDQPSISLEFLLRSISGNTTPLEAKDLSELQTHFDLRAGSPLVVYTDRRKTPPEKILQSRGDSTVTLRRFQDVDIAVAYFED